MSPRLRMTAALLAAVAGALPAAEQGSAEAGAGKVMVCLACHGVNGNSTNPEWPSLAGQNAIYTSQQLVAFKEGRRSNPIMSPQAQMLAEQDIADVAAYYAQQAPAGLEADPADWQAGEALYRSGDSQRGIPACMACHGPAGRGNPAAGYPALQAQHAVYTTKQLNDYASENRYRNAEGKVNAPANAAMMVTVAKRLTPADIRNVASYMQGMR